MSTTMHRINVNTLLPLGVVVALLLGTWAAASSWSAQVARIGSTERDVAGLRAELTEMRGKLTYTTEALIRIETRIGTLPPAMRQQEQP